MIIILVKTVYSFVFNPTLFYYFINILVFFERKKVKSIFILFFFSSFASLIIEPPFAIQIKTKSCTSYKYYLKAYRIKYNSEPFSPNITTQATRIQPHKHKTTLWLKSNQR